MRYLPSILLCLMALAASVPARAQRLTRSALVITADTVAAPPAPIPSMADDVAQAVGRDALKATAGSAGGFLALCLLFKCDRQQVRDGAGMAVTVGLSVGVVSGVIEGTARHARRLRGVPTGSGAGTPP